MAEIRPFCGLCPANERARSVIAPPYDVVNEAECRALTAENRMSFLRITRSEVDLPPGLDPHSKRAYAVARRNLDAFVEAGWLVRDRAPGFYLYRQAWRGRIQTGLMALCSVAEYDAGEIKRHELTRPDKEQDRVDNMLALDAQPGLVLLAFRDEVEAVREALARAKEVPPVWTVDTEDGVQHALIPVREPALIAALVAAFAQVPALYIADGHHRSAAASRVAEALEGRGTSGWFLAGIFPDTELQVMAYNRVVQDLQGLTRNEFMAAVEESFAVVPGTPVPSRRGEISMYLAGRWFTLSPLPGVVPDDLVGSLDVAVLQDRVLAPILGVEDPRRDTRIQFLGGIRGPEALEAAVDGGGAAVAFHLFPTGMDQLFAVADAGLLMPPKSTWFEPKLRGGVVVHRFSDT
jgi:uncharacterized protein (DUF1015 family)